MKINAIFEKTIQVETSLRNSRVDFSKLTATIVAVATDVIINGEPVVGYAFNSIGRYSCGAQLRERFIPRLLGANAEDILDEERANFDPIRARKVLDRNEKLGAHAERSAAIGTLEIALWDVVAKIEQRPLYAVLAERFGVSPVTGLLPCYVGGGFYQPGGTPNTLRDEIRGHLDAGYALVKIKAGGLPVKADLERIEAAVDLLGSGEQLAIDTSCCFDQNSAIPFARAIEPFGLRWWEEPCAPDDFDTYRAIAEQYDGTLAGGENLFAAQEVDNFLRYGRFDGKIVVQPDPPLAYGLGEFLKIIAVADSHGVPRANIIPHGGNMMSLHIAAGLGLGSVESYPGLFGVLGGFSREVEIVDGKVTLPTAPGIGFEEQPRLIDVMRSVLADGK
ncbi:enolase C-terminal domain-like protein [Bradyrhizobium prioriisuperbiae]|uniref:enolase C-terminal domain-like protein n=1 Tax=Bradyrhizobium prioriisuperbiae TaxID=2854389 RepID=UPI0028EB2A83|nr:enolase C-terminal domain-like protein [Bradyrhizobium prioritasuperba]